MLQHPTVSPKMLPSYLLRRQYLFRKNNIDLDLLTKMITELNVYSELISAFCASLKAARIKSYYLNYLNYSLNYSYHTKEK